MSKGFASPIWRRTYVSCIIAHADLDTDVLSVLQQGSGEVCDMLTRRLEEVSKVDVVGVSIMIGYTGGVN